MTATGADQRLDELCVNTIFGFTPESVAESGRAAVERARDVSKGEQ